MTTTAAMDTKARLNGSMASNFSTKIQEGLAKEFFWGGMMSSKNKELKWTFEEEDEDYDYLEHHLFLRHAVLGADANDEKHIVEVETRNFEGEIIKQPLMVLQSGKSDMVQLDLNFSHETPVTFHLTKGSGPVYLSAQHLVEFPQEPINDDFTEDEDCTETDGDADDSIVKKTTKRKAPALKQKTKRGKLDSAAADEEDSDDEDEDEEEEEGAEESDESDKESEMDDEDEGEDDEESEEMSSPEKVKKGKPVKKKSNAKSPAKKPKATVKPLSKGTKKSAKKAKK